MEIMRRRFVENDLLIFIWDILNSFNYQTMNKLYHSITSLVSMVKSPMTDTMGRMHSSAQFAGSSSVPAHVEMMGFLGIGNNPMVGCTVAVAVAVAQALAK